jgi:2-polyprenyl-6-methoxyphenol hydroxylase-like FAD-dependent oxidoreductase
MPEGVRILASMGLLPAMYDAGAGKVRGLRFRSQGGVWAEADFPPVDGEPAFSVVIRRYELDDLLVRRAASVPGVTVREGFCVAAAVYEDGAIRGIAGHPVDEESRRDTVRAPLTLGCDGMRSLFHNHYGISRTVRSRQRWGIAGHLRGVDGLRPYIEVLFEDDHEIYLAPLANDLVLVAILLEKKGMGAFRTDLPRSYHEFLKAAPGLGHRTQDSELVPPVGARGPLGFSVEPLSLPGLVLIGDSAGFIDPITGEGMTLALKSVKVALPLIRRAFDSGDFLLSAYAAERARAIDDVAKLTNLMLNVSRSRLLTEQAIGRLSDDPALFQKLLGIATGTNRYADFTLKDRLALAMG